MASSAEALLRAAARATGDDELLNELAHAAGRAAGADSTDILFRDGGDGLVLRASTVVPEMTHRIKLGKGIGLTGLAAIGGEPVFVEERAYEHPSYARYPGLDEHESEAVCALPLRGLDDGIFGVLLLRCNVRWEFDPATRAELQELAAVLGLTYKTYRAGYTLGTGVNRLGALTEVSRTISSSPYVEEILQLLVHLTAQQFEYRVCTVRLLDESGTQLVLRATQATARAYQRKRAIRIDESIAGEAISENRPVIVPDVQLEPDY
ncbi:GAF domain-containing protein, partial [bacterium]